MRESPFSRVHDAEKKILEEVANNLRKMKPGDVKGTLYLAVNKPVCPDCQRAIFTFSGEFQGKITVVAN